MIPVSFQFLHEPHTEEEVVCLFVLLLDDLFDQHGKRLDQPVIVEKVHMAFPDCVIRSGGKRIRIEFEHFGSDFKHDQTGCDMVVCWIDDCGKWRDGIRVVELSKVLGERVKDLFLTVDNPYPEPWTEKAFFRVADSYLRVADSSETGARDLEVARKVLQDAQARDLGIDWPKSRRPIFNVRGRRQFFTVRADGGFRLSLSVVLDSDQRLADFFDVWEWLNSLL